MALKLNEAYPGRFNNPSPEYPQGSFKNRTTPTAEDGSYFEQQWANDHLAFLSSLLDGAGVEANGLVDEVGSSQYFNALLQVIDDQAAIPDSLLASGIAGSFSNLKASANGTSATVTVTADAICLKNASNEQVVVNALALAINSATVGANGLDTGVLAASTWYAVWVIWNGTTAAGLLSLSTTSPTLPSGYTHKARVGWIRTDGTANKYPLGFTQAGKRAQWKVEAGTNVPVTPIMASGTAGNITTPTYVAVAVSAYIPPTAFVINFTYSAQSTLGGVVAPNASYGAGYSQTNPPFYFTGNAGGVATSISMLIESSNIYWASTGAALAANGWEDNL